MSKYNINPPKGWKAPEGIGAGDEFQELVTFRMESGGLCVTKLGDTPMQDEKDKPKVGYKDYVADMAATGEQMQQENTQ